MNLLTLIDNLGLTLVAGDGRSELSDLTDDSRQVTPGSLFVARDTGDDRWRDYVEIAVQRGAIAVIAPAEVDSAEVASAADLSVAVAPKIDQTLAGQLAARFFGHPAKKLKLLGVTGTNGKTTVATLTQYLLNTAGVKAGLLGTVAIDHGSPEGPINAELTTPGAIDLHRHFAEMVANGCEACAMEVSSHALDQGRVDGLDFAAAVFTNLTQDHLDYHGTMENYAAAKAKLFLLLGPEGVAVLNVNDPAVKTMWPIRRKVVATGLISKKLSEDAQASDVWRKHLAKAESHWIAHIEELRTTNSVVKLYAVGAVPNAKIVVFDDLMLPVIGEHNVCNALQALAAARCIVSIEPEALSDCPAVPGRLQPVRLSDHQAPAVLVDYAHTPDALENVLNALRPLIPGGGKLIVVFGCGGDRDRTKRPRMAAIACGLADVAVLTSDNPRTEDPQHILDDAIAGVPPEARDKLVVEINRAAAIAMAIRDAKPDDTVLIAGKGHEDYQILGTTKIHFDDREHAAAALRRWVSAVKPGDGHPPALGANP